MEENIKYLIETSSDDINKVLQTSITYLDRKRKLQAELLGIPPPKYVRANEKIDLEYHSSSDGSPEEEGFNGSIFKRDMHVITRAESEPESAKDSNSVTADADSFISVSSQADTTDHGYSIEYSSDQPYTSGTLRANSSEKTLNLLPSTSAAKSFSAKLQSEFIDKERDSPLKNLGPSSSMNYEENLLEFGENLNCSCSEYKGSCEECSDKELEEMLYSNGLTPNNYVLSSGRWSVNRDTQQGTKKLTIDKEFEQYFSMLML